MDSKVGIVTGAGSGIGGIGAPAVPQEDLNDGRWRHVVDVNLTGTFLCTREAFHLMRDQIPTPAKAGAG